MLRGVATGESGYTPVRPIRIGGIQFSAGPDRQQNVQRALGFARVGFDKGVRIVAYSELFSLPWFKPNDPQYLEFAEEIPGPSTEPFLALCKEYSSFALCPIYERASEGTFNTVVIVGPDGIMGRYRKNHVPNIAFWEEKLFFQPGDTGLPVFETPYAKFGIQTCWDNFFPEGSRILALNGAEIIFSPTAAAFDSEARWTSVISANAISNNLFIFRINRVGKTGHLQFYGRSFCVDPFGEMVNKPAFHRDALLIADIDLDVIRLARQEFPFLADRRPDLYHDISRPTQS